MSGSPKTYVDQNDMHKSFPSLRKKKCQREREIDSGVHKADVCVSERAIIRVLGRE